MLDEICVGRQYRKGNLYGEKGEQINIGFNPIIPYFSNRELKEYNPKTQKEEIASYTFV